MKIKVIAILFISLCAMQFEVKAESLKQIVNLSGTWKFTIGDDINWAKPDYNDGNWDYVSVPRSWEKNGFINYDGYAWYRKTFRIKNNIDHDFVFLQLGYIDDVDEVYINGYLVGSTGVFPPLVNTGYNISRKYPVPVEILNKHDENLISVRVFDDYHDGGIVNGTIGIYYDEDNELLEQNLAGYWNFETINRYQQDTKEIYGRKSGEIFVPGIWESQGFLEYDGGATYSRSFELSNSVNISEELILVLGYIDDYDKVYLNGKKIGSIDQISSNRDENEYYRIFRGYKIPNDVLSLTEENLLVIKVYDTWDKGGIYAGPIGITTAEKFKALKKNQKPIPEPGWYDIIKSIFE